MAKRKDVLDDFLDVLTGAIFDDGDTDGPATKINSDVRVATRGDESDVGAGDEQPRGKPRNRSGTFTTVAPKKKVHTTSEANDESDDADDAE